MHAILLPESYDLFSCLLAYFEKSKADEPLFFLVLFISVLII